MLNQIEDQDLKTSLAEADPSRWFIVRANNRQEKLARHSLAGEFETYLPMIPKLNRKGETYGAPLFPSFLFIRLALGMPGWTAVFSARGVASVLGCGGRPTPLADRVIAAIRGREHDGFVRMGLADEPRRRFKTGQAVTFKKGPFAALEAVFVEPVDSRRCAVLIKLLGDSSRLAHAELAHIE